MSADARMILLPELTGVEKRCHALLVRLEQGSVILL